MTTSLDIARPAGSDRLDDALERARAFLAVMRGDEDRELEKSLWGSPAGKRHLAKRIVEAMPRHRVYAEPFAGGAQVFWAKEPSEVEILADRDPEIAFAFRFVKTLTPRKLARLKRMSWVGDAERFRKLLESKPEDDVERFHRFVYLTYFSFNKLRRGTMPAQYGGVEARFIDRLEKLAPRLKQVVVRCADYVNVVDEFDGPDAFFFLDPPYPGYDAGVGHDDWDERRFGAVLRRIEGKFLVTYGVRSEVPDLFRGFHVERWQHMSSVGGGPGFGPRKTVTLIATNYRLHKAQPEVHQMLLPNITPRIEPMQKTIWGSPAGKKRLAARLVKLIPPHDVYVEPFAGSAAVFFEKQPCATEVLGDADPEIAAAFSALKTLTDDELAALRKKNWVGRKGTFKALLDAGPRSKVEKLYRFLYLSHFSYGKLRGKSFNPNADGVEATTIERIERHRERLRKVLVRRAHYAELVKEFDGKKTFFYLDPPYPGHNVEIGEDTFDEVEFRKVLDGIKGRFLVTYGTRGELDTSGFHVRKIRPPRSIRAMRGVGGAKTLPTLLIANYAFAEKSLGDATDLWTLEEVEAQVTLPPDLADDLERARVLAKALAETRDDGPLVELALELGRIESSPGEREALLAADLLPVAGALATVLSQVPGVGAALAEAAPVLADVAKARWSRAFINDLPDDAFLYVEPGGEKDGGGRIVPRSLRHFPVRNQHGEIDLPHLRNALARIPQSALPARVKEQAQAEARRLLEEAQSEVAKARRVPFQQWGGSGQYARRLADRLPEHKRYVEPFCGSAAVFYAKEPAEEEVLADIDPDVVFAQQFLQKLDDASLSALGRFNWKVSRAGFERARSCEPRSDAERFWKIAYGRLCTWGAKPNMSGFSTVNDGKAYSLEELPKFRDRIQNARIVKQDWKKTLADFDGAGTLFFLDPPYAGEWAIDDGIAPEEIADAASKLKGNVVIAYTDSARARRALKGVGRLFTMKVPEGRGAGLWLKRSRLFVSSCKLRKTDDVEWLEDAAALAPASPLVADALARPIPLLKTDEERFVLGVVLEPETVDAQKDIYSAAEVREAAHRFMEEYQNVGLMHRQLVNDRVKILESYVAPIDLEIGGGHVKKGAWLLAVRVEDDDLWKQVKDGSLSGYSIGGNAIRTTSG